MDQRLLKRRLPRVTTRQLWHFVTAAESGKLAEAGRLLRVAPSAISASIDELEATLGVQLCVRRKAKGLVLTPSGEAALALARNLLTDLLDFENAFREDDSTTSPLVVGCYMSLAPVVLPMTQARFASVLPHASLEFIEDAHDELQERLLEGTIDMAFMYDLDLDHRLKRVPLVSVTPRLLMPVDHPLAGPDAPDSVPLAMVADEPFVLFSASPLFEHYLRIFADEGIEPRIAHTCRNVGTMRAFVGRGTGLGLSYEQYDLRVSVENLEIVSKPISSGSAQPIDLCMVLPKGAKPSALTKRWMETAWNVIREPSAV
ncbi:LysR family transcriptional regulator [Microbacterium album]|uniref:LysR family transcriptional regulator n=1 Tax=Microbacterium album TaxID=2053191 RepID=A0A917IEX4_9MICO|nr:LysR family transcriptional regulator [Microbacterium album]GGH42328.1 LysR family transcriptional regulator [Microbacterium album]